MRICFGRDEEESAMALRLLGERRGTRSDFVTVPFIGQESEFPTVPLAVIVIGNETSSPLAISFPLFTVHCTLFTTEHIRGRAGGGDGHKRAYDRVQPRLELDLDVPHVPH